MVCRSAHALAVGVLFAVAAAQTDPNIQAVLQQQQRALQYANASLGKLVEFNAKCRALLNNTLLLEHMAYSLKDRTAAKFAEEVKAANDELNSKIFLLVAVSVKETDLKLNDTRFAQLRSGRACLLDEVLADKKQLDQLDGKYGIELMKSDLCNTEAFRFEEVERLAKTADNATVDLGIISRLAKSLGSSTEVPKFKKLIKSERKAAKKCIESATEAVEKTAGISGKCKKKDEKEMPGEKSTDKTACMPPADVEAAGEVAEQTQGILSDSINNITANQEQEAQDAEHALGQLGQYLQDIGKRLVDETAAKDLAKSTENSVSQDVAKQREALVDDLNAQAEIIKKLNAATPNFFSNSNDSKAYRLAVDKVREDTEQIKRLDARSFKAPKLFIDLAVATDRDRVTQFVGEIEKNTAAMVADAAAVQKMQIAIGMNETECAAEYGRVVQKHDRIMQAKDDVSYVTNVVITVFYDKVNRHVAADVARAKSGASTQLVDVIVGLLRGSVALQVLPFAVFGGFVGVGAVLAVMMQTRHRTHVFNPSQQPLLG